MAVTDGDPPETAVGAVGGRSGVGDLPRLIDGWMWRRCNRERCRLDGDSSEESTLSVAAPECLSEKKRETVVMADVGFLIAHESAEG